MGMNVCMRRPTRTITQDDDDDVCMYVCMYVLMYRPLPSRLYSWVMTRTSHAKCVNDLYNFFLSLNDE